MSAPLTFLVVDDSKLHHQMYELVFSRGSLAGSTLLHAYNGREGYAMLQAHPGLTAVFLDLNMPEMNGLEFLARRQAEGMQLHVPVVMVTTEDSPDDERRGREAGAWEYLRKPFQPADIERTVARVRQSSVPG
jgi:two-component system chemotaxis response regulator CheY